ncbi:MAG: hypothetical protein JNM56_37180 [Planctomycetia bacterium]|nr:hypothetical protein [Planctomycetia bacterium]
MRQAEQVTSTARRWTYFFGNGDSEGDPARKDLLGGKGASLAAMSRAGLPVPPGFTIATECCRHFHDNAGTWPDGLEAEVRAALTRLEHLTGRIFGTGSAPLLVSVRSGAAASMPGMMDTVLNCGRKDDPWQELVECIDAVFHSWNSDRAQVYRQHHDIRGLAGTAVTVQAMFPSERSGVVFTRNPNDPLAPEMVIESAHGLGEVVVSGEVTPDSFLVDRQTLQVKQRTPGNQYPDGQPSLADPQLQELAQIACKVEGFFGHPVDIEWGWASGQFAMLQARAIRGLDVAEDIEAGRLEEIRRLQALANGCRKVWVVHNLAETLPAPTPLTWDIIRDFMAGNGGFGQMYQDFGYRPSQRVRSEGFLELICGRIYADTDRAAELFWEGMPLTYDPDELVRDPSLLESAPAKFQADKADHLFFLRLPGLVWTMLRAGRRMKQARSRAIEQFQSLLPAYLKYVQEQRRLDLTGLPTDAVIAQLHQRCRHVLDEFGKESLKPGFFGGVARAALEQWLVQLLGEQDGKEYCAELTSGLKGDTTMAQNILLGRVARGDAKLEDFLDRYGHRAVGEMELAQPRWREDLSYLQTLVERQRRSAARAPEELHAANEARRLAAEQKLPARLAEWGGSSFREEITALLGEAQALLPYREIGKHYLMMGYELIRLATVELGRRWDLGRDVCFLSLAELERFEQERTSFSDWIRLRKWRWQSAQKLDHPDVVDSASLEQLGLRRELPAASEWKAGILSAGVVTGTAKLIFDPAECGELPANAILVCPSTDPGWTALFSSIKGLVVERGGALSHGAITARDFGLPALALPNAIRLIPDGAKLRVDGNHGLVTLLES